MLTKLNMCYSEPRFVDQQRHFAIVVRPFACGGAGGEEKQLNMVLPGTPACRHRAHLSVARGEVCHGRGLALNPALGVLLRGEADVRAVVRVVGREHGMQDTARPVVTVKVPAASREPFNNISMAVGQPDLNNNS